MKTSVSIVPMFSLIFLVKYCIVSVLTLELMQKATGQPVAYSSTVTKVETAWIFFSLALVSNDRTVFSLSKLALHPQVFLFDSMNSSKAGYLLPDLIQNSVHWNSALQLSSKSHSFFFCQPLLSPDL